MLNLLKTRLRFFGRNEVFLDSLEDYEMKILDALHSYKDYEFNLRNLRKINRTALHLMHDLKTEFSVFEHKAKDLVNAYKITLEKLSRNGANESKMLLNEYNDQMKRLLQHRNLAESIEKRLSVLKKYMDSAFNMENREFIDEGIVFVGKIEKEFSGLYAPLRDLIRPK